MTTTTTAGAAQHVAHDDHGDHHHDPTLAHHFDTHEQQFDAGKLGIWIFLVTEILFFSGLFCAYSIWRANHTEVFVYAHHYLDTKWGAINTVVLLVSSLTAAWAVRSAQLGDKKNLVRNIVLTLVCAFGFLGIKSIEYTAKYQHGTMPGNYFDPHPEAVLITTDNYNTVVGEAGELAREELAHEMPGFPAEGELTDGQKELVHQRAAEIYAKSDKIPPAVATFFSIYFFMTGLHGFHVVAGIIAFFWVLRRARRGDFTPTYFGAVDYTALYWHLVDLIWIYLFPLLYLIS
ncbi:MAG: cytochrome c oxidase subunit 3 family protein [Planctomycetota bacterium]